MSFETENVQPTKECYRCGQTMAADEQKCPVCGRRQNRICFCGSRISMALTECPDCGADWSSSHRGSRTKRRSTKVKPQDMVKSGLVGAASALGLLVAFQILLRYFARLGSDTGAVPEGLTDQLGMAVTGIGRVFAFWLQLATSRSDALLGVVVGVAIGAGVGVAVYVVRMGLLKINRRKSGSRTSRGRRRRA